MNHKISWKQCTQEEICVEHLDKSQYHADKDDQEYLQNWIQKLDILCTPQAKIGFIGSAFFLGVISCIMVIPSFADKHGRLPVLKLTYVLQLVAMIGIMMTNDLNTTIMFIYILGFSHPCKNIVGLNYVLEQMPAACRSQLVCMFILIESGWIMVISAFYQYIDRSYKTLMCLGLIVTVITLISILLMYPESPKYYHTVKNWT